MNAVTFTIKLQREAKEKLIAEIQQFFYDERGEGVGNIAAETVLDFMIKQLGPYLYNEGIKDAQKLIMERMQSVDDDLYAMKKSIQQR